MLTINSQVGSTESTSARGFIPEPIVFPPTPPGRGRTTKNSSRGRRSVNPSPANTIAEPQGVHPDLPGYSGNASSPTDPPEVSPVSGSASGSNSQASQNTNPVPISTVQNPAALLMSTTPVLAPAAPVPMSTIDHSKLPFGFGKNSLKFNDSEDVEELPAFFENIESVAARVGASSAKDLKWIALHYCEAQTKENWKALAAVNDPFTWEEFKAEVRASYPELKEIEKGSLKELKKLVEKTAHKKLQISDTAGLQQYHRKFRTMVQKLLRGTPRIINREIVKFYLTGLTPLIRQEVRSVIRTTPKDSLGSYKRAEAAWKSSNPGVAYVAPERDETDMYEWTDLLDVATRISEEESLNMFGLDSYPTADSKKGTGTVLMQGDTTADSLSDVKALASKLEKLEAENVKTQKKMAEEKAAFEKEVGKQLANSFATHMDKFTSDQHRELQQIKEAVEASRAVNSAGPASGASQTMPAFVRRSGGTANMMCYYCYENGHFILECVHLKEDISKGRVRMDSNNRARLYDGKTIPREPPQKSPRDKARAYFENRALVSQNYDETFDQYFGTADEEPESSTMWDRRNPGSEEAFDQVLTALQGLGKAYETRSRGPAGTTEGF